MMGDEDKSKAEVDKRQDESYSAVGGHIQVCTASIASEESSRGIL
jgi:hypothetical protein